MTVQIRRPPPPASAFITDRMRLAFEAAIAKGAKAYGPKGEELRDWSAMRSALEALGYDEFIELREPTS